MLGHGTLLVTNWRLKIEPDLQEPQQAQQGQEQHHLHDQHRRPRGRRPASVSRRTSSSKCSAGTPASQWRSQTCPRERQSPSSNIIHQFVHERCNQCWMAHLGGDPGAELSHIAVQLVPALNQGGHPEQWKLSKRRKRRFQPPTLPPTPWWSRGRRPSAP